MCVCVCVCVSVGSTAQKAQTTKHSHTCKGGAQRKKHKLQKTVTHARGEYSAKTKTIVSELNPLTGTQNYC